MQIDLEDLLGSEVISTEGGHIGVIDSISFSEEGLLILLDTKYAFEGDDGQVVPFKAISNDKKGKDDDGHAEGGGG